MERKNFNNSVSVLPPLPSSVQGENCPPPSSMFQRSVLEPISNEDISEAGNNGSSTKTSKIKRSVSLPLEQLCDDDDEGNNSRSHKYVQRESGPNANAHPMQFNFEGIRGKIVYACFLLLGLGMLLPWNFFITVDSYFQYKFRNTSIPSDDWKPRETKLQKLYDPMQVSVSQIINFSFLFINTLYSHLLPQNLRLLSSLLLMLLLFVITTIFVKVDTDNWQLGFFIFTMMIIVLISASGATFQGGIFGVASMFPQRFINAVGVGQALGGVFASVTRILSVYMGVDIVMSALIYFLIAVVVMVITLFVYLYVSRKTFFNYYSNPPLTQSGEDMLSKTGSNPELSVLLKEHYKIFRLIWPYATSICFIFVVTLSIFPVICVKIISTSVNEVWANLYFQPVATFLLFNLFDYFGRTLAEWILWPRRGSRLLFLISALRIVFIPLFLLCNHNPHSYIPSVFKHDAWYICFISSFGFSNGYAFALLMMYAPRMVPECDSEKVGCMMASMIGFGLLLGSFLSFAFALIT